MFAQALQPVAAAPLVVAATPVAAATFVPSN